MSTSIDSLFERLDGKRERVPSCLQRVLAIPTGGKGSTTAEAYEAADKWTSKLGKSDSGLRPVQGIALETISKYKCMMGLIGVGAGKTLICLLAGTAAGARRPLLLTPPNLVSQMESDMKLWSDHFRFTPPKIVSYGKLSVASGASILDDYKPDLVIADECHYLRKASATRTRRFLRYFHDNPTVGFIGVSGTLTGSSLLDYAHLLSLALRENAPIPLSRFELQRWAACIDSSGDPTWDDWKLIWPLVEWNCADFFEAPELMTATKRRSTVRGAYKARLHTTPGVIHTQNFSCGASLHIEAHTKITMPIEIAGALKTLESSWMRPDGEELSEAAHKVQVAKNLSLGFYYRWVWPDDIPDYDWLERRAAWNKQCRDFLTYRSRRGVDSPALLEAHILDGGGSRPLREAYMNWAEVKERPEPPKEAVWISDEIIEYAVQWLLRQSRPSILWYKSKAIERALEARGISVYGAGSPTPLGENCAASILSHGTGKNMQHYANALVLEPMSSGSQWEQLMGRFHRPGQLSDLVTFHFLDHTVYFSKAMTKAKEDALYIEESTGVRQRLNAARFFNHKTKRENDE